MEHQVGHGDEDHGFAAFGQGFVVLGQSSVLSQPGEGTLDDPAFGQDDKAGERCSLDDLDDAEVPTLGPVNELPRVSSVREDHLQSSKAGSQLPDQQPGPVAVLNVRRMYDQRQDQTQRVDDHVPLAAQRFLARVVPAIPLFQPS